MASQCEIFFKSVKVSKFKLPFHSSFSALFSRNFCMVCLEKLNTTLCLIFGWLCFKFETEDKLGCMT
ncbi:hypothetical protein Peur_044012 [Populus x canadensis]